MRSTRVRLREGRYRSAPQPRAFVLPSGLHEQKIASQIGPSGQLTARRTSLGRKSSHCLSSVAYDRTVKAKLLHQVTVRTSCQN